MEEGELQHDRALLLAVRRVHLEHVRHHHGTRDDNDVADDHQKKLGEPEPDASEHAEDALGGEQPLVCVGVGRVLGVPEGKEANLHKGGGPAGVGWVVGW